MVTSTFVKCSSPVQWSPSPLYPLIGVCPFHLQLLLQISNNFIWSAGIFLRHLMAFPCLPYCTIQMDNFHPTTSSKRIIRNIFENFILFHDLFALLSLSSVFYFMFFIVLSFFCFFLVLSHLLIYYSLSLHLFIVSFFNCSSTVLF